MEWYVLSTPQQDKRRRPAIRVTDDEDVHQNWQTLHSVRGATPERTPRPSNAEGHPSESLSKRPDSEKAIYSD